MAARTQRSIRMKDEKDKIIPASKEFNTIDNLSLLFSLSVPMFTAVNRLCRVILLLLDCMIANAAARRSG